MPGPTTSPIAAAIAVEGTLLQLGDGESPENFYTVANVEDWNEPNKTETVDVTNVGNLFRARMATLLDMGQAKFKIFWVMTETTHYNDTNAPPQANGLRYMWRNRILGTWQIVYPDGFDSADVFDAYVTSFSITGATGKVFEAEIELSPNDQNPTLV